MCIYLWTDAIYSFYFVNKEVKPKKIMLAQAQEKADVLSSKLAIKQAELQKAVDHVNNLNDDLQKSIQNKEALEKKYQECTE